MTRSVGVLKRLASCGLASSSSSAFSASSAAAAHVFPPEDATSTRSIPITGNATTGARPLFRPFHSLASATSADSSGNKNINSNTSSCGRGSASLRRKERGNNGPLRLGLTGVTSSTTEKNFMYTTSNTATAATRDIDEDDRLLVVGSGVAGCAAALVAAETHRVPVTLLFAGSAPTDCNSYWAQGGIISRNDDPDSGDSAESLASDIHRAGAGLCVDEAVWKVAAEGPKRVKQLLLDDRAKNGGEDGRVFANVPFDRLPDGSLSHCLEASHAAPRILHRADSTGAAITQHITQAAVDHPLVTIVSDTIVTDLAVTTDPASPTGERVCVGAHILDRRTCKTLTLLAARGTLLASGGLAGIYEHSTNPAGFNALGSSTAIATRAGAKMKDLEYVQFHPTSLYLPNEARFLLTEALRGEGAILRDANGRAFAKDFHVDGELAPRDIVARGVYAEAQKTAGDGRSFIMPTWTLLIVMPTGSALDFPPLTLILPSASLDITKDHLPVIPAAHYTCGGIQTDLDGRSNLRGSTLPERPLGLASMAGTGWHRRVCSRDLSTVGPWRTTLAKRTLEATRQRGYVGLKLSSMY